MGKSLSHTINFDDQWYLVDKVACGLTWRPVKYSRARKSFSSFSLLEDSKP